MAWATLGFGVSHRGCECPRGAQCQSSGSPPSRRTLAPRGSARLGLGPMGVAGRVCVCGRRPATGEPARPAGGRCPAS
eukprot:5868814-Alexandrium_andersonii.AAC.1